MRTVSKKQQIEMYLRAELQRGRWAVGEQMSVEDDLLEELGVNRSTLREALSSLTAEGVIARKQGIGTFVERIPEPTIALCTWFDNLASREGYYYRDLVNGFRDLVESKNFNFDIVLASGRTIDGAAVSSGRQLSIPAARDYVGAINLVPNARVDEQFAGMGIPSVNVHTGVPIGTYSVVLDYDQLVKKTLEIMQAYGSDDFAVFGMDELVGRETESFFRERDRWFDMLVGGDKSRLILASSMDDVYDAFVRWWANRKTDTIFFTDDSLFDIATRAMLELEIRIPGELRVVTHANVGRQFSIPYKVDRIGYDAGDVVAAAWSMLDTLVSGQRPDEDTIYIDAKCELCGIQQGQLLTLLG